MSAVESKVAKYVSAQIALSEKSHKEIAEECGFKSNMLSMIRTGTTKLPINKVALMAKALGVDKRHLLRIVMQEYTPDTWVVLEEVMGDNLGVSADDLAFVKFVRKVTKDDLPDLTDASVRAVIEPALNEAAKVTRAKTKAAIERYERAPANNKPTNRKAQS